MTQSTLHISEWQCLNPCAHLRSFLLHREAGQQEELDALLRDLRLT